MIVELNELKEYIGMSTDPDPLDAFLTSQLELVQEAVEAYCRRKFEAKTWEQTFYSDEYRLSLLSIDLFHYPLISVDSIVIDDVTLDSLNYRVHAPSGTIRRTDCIPFFCGGSVKTVVTYSAGYESGDMPRAIKQVIKDLVQERYNKKIVGVNQSFGNDVQSISIPGTISIAFDYTLQNNTRDQTLGMILGSSANILDQFRSNRAVIGSNRIEYVEEA